MRPAIVHRSDRPFDSETSVTRSRAATDATAEKYVTAPKPTMSTPTTACRRAGPARSTATMSAAVNATRPPRDRDVRTLSMHRAPVTTKKPRTGPDKDGLAASLNARAAPSTPAAASSLGPPSVPPGFDGSR